MSDFVVSPTTTALRDKFTEKTVLVTGSSGHLGEALCRTLSAVKCKVIGIDILPSDYTTHVGSILDRNFVKERLVGVECVFHTATLHKPHIISHTKQDFVDVNVTGTLNLLEESVTAGVQEFIFTSSTTVFGDAMKAATPVWVTESLNPIPKNIYGVTKFAAENLCELFYRNNNLSCIILRTSRFFLELDDDPSMLEDFCDENIKCNELLYRRVDLQDVVDAHLGAVLKCKEIGFDKFIISAPTLFKKEDVMSLQNGAKDVVAKRFPEFQTVYSTLGWEMFARFDRVYDSTKAQRELDWRPQYTFQRAVEFLSQQQKQQQKQKTTDALCSPLAAAVGCKGYHV